LNIRTTAFRRSSYTADALAEIVPLSLRPNHGVATAVNVVSLTVVHNIPGTRDIFHRSVFEIRSHRRRPDLSRNFTMDSPRFTERTIFSSSSTCTVWLILYSIPAKRVLRKPLSPTPVRRTRRLFSENIMCRTRRRQPYRNRPQL